MLHEFLAANRTELIERCGSKVAGRPGYEPSGARFEHGIPLFLDQLIRMLRAERSPDAWQTRSASSDIAEAATRHGVELLEHGFTVEQVVRDYGDLCQAITDLAFERAAPIEIDEFRTLNRCMDDAIADAVTEFSRRHDLLLEEKGARAANERLGSLAHELRNFVHTATLAVTALKMGHMGLGGATGAVLDRSLTGLQTLIDRSLAEVRACAGVPARQRLVSVAGLIAEARSSAALEAHARGCELAVAGVERHLAVEADRVLLLGALGNLLQNALKFTAPRTQVSLRGYAEADRVLIEVAIAAAFLPARRNGCSRRSCSPAATAPASGSG